MKKILLTAAVIIAVVILGFNYLKKQHDEIRIYPLSPYADSIKFSKDEDVSTERRNGIQIRFFVFDNDPAYTPASKNKMDAYITKYLHKELKQHKAIYFTFYKATPLLDKDSQHTLADLEKNHKQDKFAEYEYLNAKLYNFDFYKNGEYYEPTAADDADN